MTRRQAPPDGLTGVLDTSTAGRPPKQPPAVALGSAPERGPARCRLCGSAVSRTRPWQIVYTCGTLRHTDSHGAVTWYQTETCEEWEYERRH